MLLLLLTLLAACSGDQAVMNPKGTGAALIAQLSWILFAGAGLIFAIVLALLLYGLCSRPERRARVRGNTFIVWGGVVFPVVTLSALLIYVFRISAALTAPPENPLIVDVTAHQWWWEFRYRSDAPHLEVVTANELHLPVGRPVELRLHSADVIHTFWVPNLGGKRDMIPGVTNTLVLEASEPGIFRGQCNEFCGAQHALMVMHVVAEPEQRFNDWLARQRLPGAEPADELSQRGQDVFLSAGCPVCHRVGGTEALAENGPDLTHFGGRRMLGAGVLRNTQANREAWILSAQHFKPGNHMPNMALSAEDLRALATYLGSLQ